MAETLADLGPYFAVDRHERATRPVAPWLPLRTVLTDPHALASRVEQVRQFLPGDQVQTRTAVSVMHLGLIARLVSPTIGAITLGEPGLSLAVDDIWWQDSSQTPPLSFATAPPDAKRPLEGSAIEAVTEVVGARYSVSATVLWGNVGSAINGAATAIRVTRPHLASAAQAAADELLRDPRVDGGQLRSGPGFRRRSCCLIYRSSPYAEGICGDCVLRALTPRPR